VLSFFLLTNAYRLFKAVMGDPGQYPGPASPKNPQPARLLIRGIPAAVYLQAAGEFVVQFFTQKKIKACGTPSQKVQWINHLLIMTGYSIVFLLVVVGLRWFQRDQVYAVWHPVRLLGYYATFAILYGTTVAMIGRIKKSKTVYTHSHSSDWAFLVLLWLTAFTGILIHAGRLLELPMTTYTLYVIHMMIAVPMLVIEVPFAKWTHQLYRPLVLYLMKVKASAFEKAP